VTRRAPSSPRLPRPRRTAGGFTLIELMVVVSIMIGILALVPMNLQSWGARSRLEGSANTLVAVVSASRSQAILDGYPVKLELGTFRDEDGELRYGHRWVVTNMPAERSDLLDADGESSEDTGRPQEREWVTTYWSELPSGVTISGISERGESWSEPSEDEPYSVEFGPDGSVERGFAVRLEAPDLEVDQEERTITIVVNPLTAEAASYDGYRDVPKQREEHEFNK
jgi:type II secretory pathway pseudopilin PulG